MYTIINEPTHQLSLATAKKRDSIMWKNGICTWQQLVTKLSETFRTYETLKEYKAMAKTDADKIKDIGGFVGGRLREGRRKKDHVEARSLISLDADYAVPEFYTYVKENTEFAMCCYSTHKHTPEHPRLRLIIPLDREVMPDEYEAIARKIAERYGMDYFDDTTYEPERMMYYPSTSKDGEYFYDVIDKPILKADSVLSKYKDWKDISYWPESTRSQGIRKRKLEKAEDPLKKEGIVGTFCRCYTIQEAIAEFIPDVYEETTGGRYTYLNGSSASGLVIYEDKWAYSNHSTDPINGHLANAFDIVRVHKFGEADINCNESTPMNKRPSWLAMIEFTKGLKAVRDLADKERDATAHLAFTNTPNPSAELSNDIFAGVSETPKDTNWMDQLDRIGKDNKVAPSLKNFALLVQNWPEVQRFIKGYDKFTLKYYVHPELAPWARNSDFDTWTDEDDAALRTLFSAKWGIEGREKINDAISMSFLQRQFHAVKDFIEEVEWDGVPRVDTLLVDYFGAMDNVYTRSVTRKTFAGAVARIYDPGCKFDYVLSLMGGQGAGKTSFFLKLAHKWGSNSLPDVKGKESYEALDSVWIMELGELSALKKSDRDTIKNYLSKQEDTYRKAYGHRTQTYRRHNIFVATTNESLFLEDNTGNRRFWVVQAYDERKKKDVFTDLTMEEIHQIWAEAKVRYDNGEPLYLTKDLEEQAKVVQESYSVADAFEGMIEKYLNTPIPADWKSYNQFQRVQYYKQTESYMNDEIEKVGLVERTQVSIVEIWVECFDKGDITTLKRSDSLRINAILEKLGWKKSDKTIWRGCYGSQRGFEKIK